MSPRPCRGNLPRLIALLDGALAPRASEKVRAHLGACPACADALRRLELARDACRELGQRDAPDINFRQVEAQVRWRLASGEKKRRRFQLGIWPALGALATTAALGALVGALLHANWTERPTVVPDQKLATPAPVEPTAPLRELAALPTVVSGTARVATAGGLLGPLDINRPLLEGERAITEGGEIALQWGAGTGLRLGPNSELRFVRLRDGEQQLLLLRGRVTLTVSKRHPRDRFSVVGGGLRVRVKGTRFAVGLEQHATRVDVYEGVVAVEPTSGSWERVQLPPGYVGGHAQEAGKVVGIDVRAGFGLHADASHVPRIARLMTQPEQRELNLQAQWTSLQRMIATTAALTVETDPAGADLHVDSVPLGSTTLAFRGTLGRHLVELWRDGKLLRRQWVELGGVQSRLALDLRPRARRRAPRLPAEIYAVFRRKAVLIRACYERALKQRPKLAGTLVLRLAVDASGTVSEAEIERDTLRDTAPDPRVARCALATVRSWTFPSGHEAELVYPFSFRPR